MPVDQQPQQAAVHVLRENIGAMENEGADVTLLDDNNNTVTNGDDGGARLSLSMLDFELGDALMVEQPERTANAASRYDARYAALPGALDADSLYERATTLDTSFGFSGYSADVSRASAGSRTVSPFDSSFSVTQELQSQFPIGAQHIPRRNTMDASALLELESALNRSTVPSSMAAASTASDGKRGRDTAMSPPPTKSSRRRKNKRRSSSNSTAAVEDDSDSAPRRRSGAKKSSSRTRVMPPSSHLSLEERRRIRAERNRESAEKSRLRHKQRTEELERDVYHKRIENREVKASIDTYYGQLRGVADTIERGGSGAGDSSSEVGSKVPALYDALDVMQKAIESCTWTYKDPREPEIPLKVPRSLA